MRRAWECFREGELGLRPQHSAPPGAYLEAAACACCRNDKTGERRANSPRALRLSVCLSDARSTPAVGSTRALLLPERRYLAYGPTAIAPCRGAAGESRIAARPIAAVLADRPTILVLLAIQVYPALYTVWLSLQEREPAGWDVRRLQELRTPFGHGSCFLAESVGQFDYLSCWLCQLLTMTLGFIVALLLNRRLRFSGFYITLLFIPWIIANIIAGLVFRLLVIPDYGLLSGILQNPAIFPPDGLSVLTAVAATTRRFGTFFPFPPAPAMTFLILASAWRGAAVYYAVITGRHADGLPTRSSKAAA